MKTPQTKHGCSPDFSRDRCAREASEYHTAAECACACHDNEAPWLKISEEPFDRLGDALAALKDRGGVLGSTGYLTTDGKLLRVESEGPGRGFKLITLVKAEGAK